ncbi:amino acid transporter [Labilithrix luteola]|uniref:Amino acid transporter n=1 Tax=Labilithrix luteola TaxID=1391654 RepID=A0A0K1QAH6_9BACT|nr:amino acid permease [Labilithrix luteola]AKV02723.1 amino acid transporter [Labilithrix luteola]
MDGGDGGKAVDPRVHSRHSQHSHEPGSADSRALGRLGYAQELVRRMGGFSSFAVSFSIISVLTGCITAYSDAIGPGGPAALGIGWPLVSVGTMLVALAMAELASAFPTAGALYHWSALLGGPGWGWLTASMNLVGQIAIVAAIDFGCASELAATLGLSSTASFWLLAAILTSHAVVNAASVRIVAWLNDFSATVHILGVVLIVGALLLFGRAQPLPFLFETGFTTRADGSLGLGFLNGLVLSMFTFTGYDASAHLAEETHDPARRTPWGILTSVGVSAVAGYLLLTSITLAIRDLPAIASDKHAALLVMRSALGDGFGRLAMGLALAAMWFCGLSSVTSASRTLYAFSRDKGLPGSRFVSRVNPVARTPIVAIGVATVGPLLLVLGTAPFSDSLFDAMAKMATMGLYVSYAVPILLGAVARHRRQWLTRGPFSLGRFGLPVAWAAVTWGGIVLIVCSLPPNQLPAGMLAFALLVLATIYFTFVRHRFEGPKVKLATLEAERHGDTRE